MGGGYAPASTAETLAVLATFISSVNIAGESQTHRHLIVLFASYSNFQPIKYQLKSMIEVFILIIQQHAFYQVLQLPFLPTCSDQSQWLCLRPHTFIPAITLNNCHYNDKVFLQPLQYSSLPNGPREHSVPPGQGFKLVFISRRKVLIFTARLMRRL